MNADAVNMELRFGLEFFLAGGAVEWFGQFN